jgi:hypothetical protein
MNLTGILRALAEALPRHHCEPANRYCAICDGYHPRGAVLFTGQRLCHTAAGQPLPFQHAPVNEDWIFPGDPRHSGASRETVGRAADARDRGRDLW